MRFRLSYIRASDLLLIFYVIAIILLGFARLCVIIDKLIVVVKKSKLPFLVCLLCRDMEIVEKRKFRSFRRDRRNTGQAQILFPAQ